MKLLKAMVTVSGLTGLSRIAGFARDVITAAILGAGPVADAFFVAFRLPNFFRRVTAEGSFSVAFIPLYAEALEKEGQESAEIFASRAFWVMALILGVFTVICMIFMPAILHVIAPGFTQDPDQFALAVTLSRITFSYLLLMSLTALLGGMLNAHNRFGPFAFAPTLFNLCMVVALLWAGLFENAGYAMAWGIVAAGFVQLGWLWANLKASGLRIRFVKPQLSARIKRVFKLMGPGLIGAGAQQINLFIDTIIASFLATGAISYLYYADRLNQLPLGMVGIAVGTALLPMLSRALSQNNQTEARDLFNRALEMCLILALPAAAALCVMPHSLISVLFERGEFKAADTLSTAQVLAGYSIGLPAYICIKVFASAHWARQDTMTPVKIAIIGTVFNTGVALGLIFFAQMGVAGIALATGLSAWVQFVMHLRALRDHPAIHFDDRFKRVWPRMVAATTAMSIFLCAAGSVLALYNETETLRKLIGLLVLVGGGGGIYAACIFGLGVLKVSEIKKFLQSSKEKPGAFVE
ncbi:MAG: murein biosynthesis integral membrane protein MurJ [Alphaproteobacteria bacterium]|nr:murein biosynthesis integral membrane protein MurJ [Alphaproteobacteria bacterium]